MPRAPVSGGFAIRAPSGAASKCGGRQRRPNAGRTWPISARTWRKRDVSDRLTSVVYFDSAPRRGRGRAVPGHAVLDQRDERFVPHVLAVTTGTVVDFPNSDRIYHNVFSLSKTPARSISAAMPAGRSKAIRFDRPGIVRVFCDIHSHMNAFILVFSHSFFALTDAEGRYRIDNVPPGTYSLVAWNEGVSSESQAGASCPTAARRELDFALR